MRLDVRTAGQQRPEKGDSKRSLQCDVVETRFRVYTTVSGRGRGTVAPWTSRGRGLVQILAWHGYAANRKGQRSFR